MAKFDKQKWQREYMSKRLKEDPEFKKRQKQARQAWKKKRREAVTEVLTEFRKEGCFFCKETTPCCLDAHHFKDKNFTISVAIARIFPLDAIIAELYNCICLCKNCHSKVHAKLLQLPSGL